VSAGQLTLETGKFRLPGNSLGFARDIQYSRLRQFIFPIQKRGSIHLVRPFVPTIQFVGRAAILNVFPG